MWGVRPSHAVWAHLQRVLTSGRFQCGVGDQTAAMQFFTLDKSHRTSQGRLANLVGSLHAGFNLKANLGALSCLAKLEHYVNGKGNLTELARNGDRSARPVITAAEEEALQLQLLPRRHVSPRLGAVNASARLGRLARHAHVIHWSGTRKPMEAGTKAKDALEHIALEAYRRDFNRFLAAILSDEKK